MKKRIVGTVIGSCLMAAAALGVGPVSMIPAAHAVPGQCAGGYALGNGGAFCDFDAWPDGSFMHWERVCVLGFCGENTFRACPVPGGRVPADYDPNTPC